MSYDEKLARRIEQLFDPAKPQTSKKMFGGLAFFVKGHMAIAASGKGGILVRVDPEIVEKISAESDVEVAIMRGKAMRGWLRVSAKKPGTKRQLKRWFDLSMDYADTLPDKV